MKTNERNSDAEAKPWPNTVRTRQEIDAALEEGEKSGISPLSAREVIDRALKK